jgi:hypothetical protein
VVVGPPSIGRMEGMMVHVRSLAIWGYVACQNAPASRSAFVAASNPICAYGKVGEELKQGFRSVYHTSLVCLWPLGCWQHCWVDTVLGGDKASCKPS